MGSGNGKARRTRAASALREDYVLNNIVPHEEDLAAPASHTELLQAAAVEATVLEERCLSYVRAPKAAVRALAKQASLLRHHALRDSSSTLLRAQLNSAAITLSHLSLKYKSFPRPGDEVHVTSQLRRLRTMYVGGFPVTDYSKKPGIGERVLEALRADAQGTEMDGETVRKVEAQEFNKVVF